MKRGPRKRWIARNRAAELALVIALVSVFGASCAGQPRTDTKLAGPGAEELGCGATESGPTELADPALDPFARSSTYVVYAWTTRPRNDLAHLVDLLPRRFEELMGDPGRIAGLGIVVPMTKAREAAEILDRFGFTPLSLDSRPMGPIRYSGSVTVGRDILRREVGLTILFQPI